MTADFDHVALAAPSVHELLQTLCQLGCTVLWGRHARGFRWVLVRLGEAREGMNVELLEPWRPEQDEFLHRFVQRRGTAVHHITFKVPDIEAAIARLQAAGIQPVDIRLDDPEWREAFVRPRDAHGIVVQLAQSAKQRPGMEHMLELARAPQRSPELDNLGIGSGAPWLPEPLPPRAASTAVGRRLVLQTPDVPGAVNLYAGLLGGEASGSDDTVEVTWPNGATLRVLHGDDARVLALEYTGGVAAQGPAAALFRAIAA